MAKKKNEPVKIGVVKGSGADRRFPVWMRMNAYSKDGTLQGKDVEHLTVVDYCGSCCDYTVRDSDVRFLDNDDPSFKDDKSRVQELNDLPSVCSHCGREMTFAKKEKALSLTMTDSALLFPSTVTMYETRNSDGSLGALKCRQTGYMAKGVRVVDSASRGAIVLEPFTCDYVFDLNRHRSYRMFDAYINKDRVLENVQHSFKDMRNPWSKIHGVNPAIQHSVIIDGNFRVLSHPLIPGYRTERRYNDSPLYFLYPHSEDLGIGGYSSQYPWFSFSKDDMSRLETDCIDMVYKELAKEFGLPESFSLDRLNEEDGLFQGNLGTCDVPWDNVLDAKVSTIYFLTHFRSLSEWSLNRVNTEIGYTGERMRNERQVFSEEKKEYMRLAELTDNMRKLSFMDVKMVGDLSRQKTGDDVDRYLRNIVFGFDKKREMSDYVAINTEDAKRDAYYGKKLRGRFNIAPLLTAHNVYTLQKAGVNTLDYVNLAFQRVDELKQKKSDELKKQDDGVTPVNLHFGEGMIHRISTKDEMALIRTLTKSGSHKRVVENLTDFDVSNLSKTARMFSLTKDFIAKGEDDFLYNDVITPVLNVVSNTMEYSKSTEKSNGSSWPRHVITSKQMSPLPSVFQNRWGKDADAIFREIVDIANLYVYMDDEVKLPTVYSLSEDNEPILQGSFQEMYTKMKAVSGFTGYLDFKGEKRYGWSDDLVNRLSYVTRDGKYSFRLARDDAELEQVSSLFSNCVRTYKHRCKNQSTYLVFMRDEHENYIASIEVTPNNSVRQFKTYYNKALCGEEEVAAAREWLKETGLSCNCSDVSEFDSYHPYHYPRRLDALGQISSDMNPADIPSAEKMKKGLQIVRSRLEAELSKDAAAKWKSLGISGTDVSFPCFNSNLDKGFANRDDDRLALANPAGNPHPQRFHDGDEDVLPFGV